MAENKQSWIKLNRSIMEHWLWMSDEPFSRGQAFVDLLLMAAYTDHAAVSQGRRVVLKRGSMITSIRVLASRWGWSKDKVTRFLNDLESDGMIEKASDTKRTVLTLVNYEKYQDFPTTERTQNGRKSDTERTQIGQTEERKRKENNIYNARARKNSFNNFPQREYDTAQLERDLLKRDEQSDLNEEDEDI